MTDKYAVIGNPIAHSKSPHIHKMFAAQTGQDMSYEAILAPLDGFSTTIEQLRAEGYKGCNVTVPFKFEAFKIATGLDPFANSAQAVNTLKFEGDTITGYNTDGLGLVSDIQNNIGMSLANKNILLLGAGGAAQGVITPLLAEKCRITIVNRNPEKAQQLVDARGTTLRIPFAAMDKILDARDEILQAQSYTNLTDESYTEKRQYDIVINATSAGLTDSELPPLPPTIFAPGALAYDIMYGRETSFMKFAREHGAAIVSDGLGMLVGQAAESFFIWRNMRPDTRSVLTKLRAELPIA